MLCLQFKGLKFAYTSFDIVRFISYIVK